MIKISQKAIAESIVAKFGVTSNRESVALKEDFYRDEPDVEEPFLSLVGHLMWLANNTRPDTMRCGPLRGIRMRQSWSAGSRRSTF